MAKPQLEKASEILMVRCTPTEKQKFAAAAGPQPKQLSRWVKESLRNAANEQAARRPR